MQLFCHTTKIHGSKIFNDIINHDQCASRGDNLGLIERIDTWTQDIQVQNSSSPLRTE